MHVEQLLSRSAPYAGGGRPPIFFGRDSIVSHAVNHILEGAHVALIGPGGIGKSSISRALLHEQSIISRFGLKRYFVPFDDLDTSELTYDMFLDRLAVSLGFSSKSSEGLISHLTGVEAVIVLDNAETFLELRTGASSRISTTIRNIGSLPLIRLVFTSRSKKIPHSISYQSIIVESLGASASRDAFNAVYSQQLPNRKLDKLLAELDYHPLSISLLANVARHNGWSIDMLLDEWKDRKTLVLDAGVGKEENLGASIELSINCPAFHGNTTSVRELLRAIAFLPQGIHRKDLLGLFPQLSAVKEVADALGRCCLASWKDDRISMLGAIRLYIMDSYNSKLVYTDPVLSSIRSYYYQQITDNTKAWIQCESANTERLLAFDLCAEHDPDDRTTRHHTLEHLSAFLRAQHEYYPRSTGLLPGLEAVSEAVPWFKISTFTLGGTRPSVNLMILKAKCLVELCWLRYERSHTHCSIQDVSTAEMFCRSHAPECDKHLADSLRLKGSIHRFHREFEEAEKAFSEASTIALSLKDFEVEATLKQSLSQLALLRGHSADARKLASSAQRYAEVEGNYRVLHSILLHQVEIELYENDLERGRSLLEKAIDLDSKHSSGGQKFDLLLRKASLEGWAGNLDVTMAILEEVQNATEPSPSHKSEFSRFVEALQAEAFYDAQSGNYERARTHIQRAEKLASTTSKAPLIKQFPNVVLMAAYVELFAGNFPGANHLLLRLLEICNKKTKLNRSARVHRALGEIAFLRGDSVEANMRFSKTEEFSRKLEITPSLLYVRQDRHWYTLPEDRFVGWRNYLDLNVKDDRVAYYNISSVN